MNCVFYEAIDRVPLATVGAIEFLGPIGLAAAGLRTRRNLLALALAVGGVFLLTNLRITRDLPGFLFAFSNCAIFVLYVVLAHRIAADGGTAGIDRLGAAMLVAMLAALPFGIGETAPVLASPVLLAAAIGVGICSSVIPYVCDQLAMARLPRELRADALVASGDGTHHRRASAETDTVNPGCLWHRARCYRRGAASPEFLVRERSKGRERDPGQWDRSSDAPGRRVSISPRARTCTAGKRQATPNRSWRRFARLATAPPVGRYCCVGHPRARRQSAHSLSVLCW